MLPIFEEAASYVGFSATDADLLRETAPAVAPRLPAVVDRFYREILAHPAARRVLHGGEAQVERLRGHLLRWLETLFGGTYDAAYWRERSSIGRVHVAVGLPQHFMVTAMEVVWQELHRIIRELGLPNADDRRVALHKLLSLELAIMLDSYRERYTDQVREIERSAIRERLTRAEHLAELGQLAASLAHEVKNPLAGISGAIQVIRDATPGEHVHRPILEEVLRQITRLDRTVRDLLSYARPARPQIKACNLAELIDRVSALLAREPAFQRVACEVDCDGVPAIEADEHQVAQLLVNLLLNAAHASQAGQTVRVIARLDGDSVTVAVRDEGHGMDEEVCRRAFEPFFTTKAKGTGLGLSICQRIVDTLGGTISIESRIGAGTTVRVRLPARQSARPVSVGSERPGSR